MKKVSQRRLREIINEQATLHDSQCLRFRDNEYTLYPLARWEQFIRNNQTDKRLFIPEEHDCDDFASIFRGDAKKRGMTAGEITVQRRGEDTGRNTHMVNLIVTEDETVRIFEPQTDIFYDVDKILLIEGQV